MKRVIIILAAVLAVVACGMGESGPWAEEEAWFQTGEKVNAGYADVLYFVSTNIMDSQDEDGNNSLRAVLNDGEKAVLALEMDYIHKNIFPDSLNFFAPFYHQVTFETFSAPQEELDMACRATEQECLDAFNYYMDNVNGGRPYILAGFSQGALMVKSIVKNMTDSQFERMAAAYVIGFEITVEDLQSPHIIPAEGPRDKGVTVSFNSVCSTDSIWPLVCADPAVCINPVNWCTDSTPAPLWDGDIALSASVDPEYNVVVVSGYGDNPPKPAFDAPWRDGNLHHQEIKIYNNSLARNALDRAYGL